MLCPGHAKSKAQFEKNKTFFDRSNAAVCLCEQG
jgi:hypothetical protein